jgi:phosphoglycolate phosphatase
MRDIDFNVIALDLDGTLADTAPDLAASLNHVLARFGRNAIAEQEVRHLVGHGARALLRKGLAATGEAAETLVDQGYPMFLEYYAAHICDRTRPYEGVARALDDLAARGIGLAICTNKPEAMTLRLVKALGWSERFEAIVAADTLPVKKPDPAPLLEAVARAGGGQAAFVGDSITDADTARAAGIPLVAVSFGFSDRPAHALRAARVIDHYDELVPALASMSAAP